MLKQYRCPIHTYSWLSKKRFEEKNDKKVEKIGVIKSKKRNKK